MTLLLSLFISLFFSSAAHAQYDSSSFSFSIAAAPEAGCAKVNYFYANNDFPSLPKGEVESVRFYYSTVSPDAVTEKSEFQEANFMKDNNDSWALSNNEFCGLAEGKTYFKYGLVDNQGTVIEFQEDFDDYSNVADIEPAKP